MTSEIVHRWYMPFLYITLASLVSVPAAIYFEHGMPLHPGTELGLGYGTHWVRRDDLLAALVPYLLNIGAVVWFFSENGSTRWAAFWASLVGFARIVAPVSLALMSDVAAPGARHFVDWGTLRYLLWFQDFEMLVLGVLLWTAFGRFVGSSEMAGAGAFAEA
ncbi:MAG TPA: hypothetical protein VFC53_09135 [Dehalococcoidia bacterium]|jgi:hypothetical protein|nr:hypothetical protein [Dehalococcoidia bacterium]